MSIPITIADNWLRLLVWTIFSGHLQFRRSGKFKCLQWKITNRDKLIRLTQLLITMRVQYTLCELVKGVRDKENSFIIRIFGVEAQHIMALLQDRKAVPRWFRDLPVEKQGIIKLEQEFIRQHTRKSN